MRSTETGMTLVELAIGVALMLILLGLAYPGFNLASGTISTCTQQARLQDAGEKVSGELIDLIRLGRLREIGSQGVPPYAIIHPPRTGIALSEIASTGAVPWRSDSVRIQYRKTGEVHEAGIHADLNGDGDRLDLFALGIVEIITPEGTRPITHRGRVLLALPSYEGDVDGDGRADPLFKVAGRRFDLKMVMNYGEEPGKLRMAVLTRTLYLRNRQD